MLLPHFEIPDILQIQRDEREDAWASVSCLGELTIQRGTFEGMEWEYLRLNKGCLRYGVEGPWSNMRHLGDGAGWSLVQHRGFWRYESGEAQ